MKKSYRLTPAAEDDLFEIWAFIATDNLEAADRVEGDILNACARLAGQPESGHFRRDLTDKPVRFFTVRATYLIVYDPATDPLEIIRILHGARDIATELDTSE
jgi:plasmid stabilization system protein ParE